MDEIKTGIQKSRLRRFGHGMRLGEERIPKRNLPTKMEGRLPRRRPRTRWIDQIRRDIEMRGGNTRKQEVGE